MRLSIIIPVLNEEQTIGATLTNLVGVRAEEVIVVDGGSDDRTREIVRQGNGFLTSSVKGRARQMNHGARIATGDVLLFLHADTRLPHTAKADIDDSLRDARCVGGRFDVQLDSQRWLLVTIGRLISFRSRLSRVATGDQAIFVRRKAFEELGGFPDIPLMEDIAFSRMLKAAGPIACLESKVITSARRWEKNGPIRTIFLMWTLKSLYLAGVSPHLLARLYTHAR